MSNYTSKWANLPESEADLAGEAAPVKKGWTKKRKTVVATSAIAAVLIPGAAWAAVALFGFGSFSAAAETSAGQLDIVAGTTHLSKKLLPGSTVGLVMRVANPTDAAVTVQGVIVNTTNGFTVTKKDPNTGVTSPDTDNSCKLSLAPGGTADSIPPHGSVSTSTAGQRYAPDHAISIPAGNNEEITFPNVFKQDPTATYLCGVTGDFAVKGLIGS